ncbi:hypothetical protein ACG01O_13685 [Roseateles sp. BYS87W]|uniref:Carboxypeptidase regulatory-like domain-containing protein n=1 Tax=Pelomonas baiyunensis TaxID=3299026 RepID=A0ABW7H0A1_9BURK
MAAGLALNGATVRVLDTTGKVVASGRSVTAATGAYGPITLTGTGTFRVEACGTVGDKPLCVWALTNAGGTVNLTPLTSAVAVLASGQGPETLMSDALSVSDTSLIAAQSWLRLALAPAFSDAGLASDFNVMTGVVAPGTHTGHDRVLDTVGVGLGADTKGFVTLEGRMGGGQAYLEPANTLGSLQFAPAAANLDLPGLDTLFSRMALAVANSATCQSGLAAVFDSAARSSLDPTSLTSSGAVEAAQLICLRMGGVLGDGEVLFGGKLLPTTLGRCDFSGTDPVCRVNLMFQTSKGFQRALGVEQVAVKRAAGWLFLGNRLEVQATATARLVLTRRVDSLANDSYSRYLDVAIPAINVSGGAALQCARVSQKDSSGADVPLGLFKRAGGNYLSLWSASAGDPTPSLDPASGATRGSNVVALPLASGTAGDAVVRNFVRNGRALKVELFADTVCSTPLNGLDGASVSIDVAGLLPLASTSQTGQPWPALAAAATTALVGLKGSAGGKLTFAPTWTLPRASLAVNRAQLCTDKACTSKLADLELAAGATTAAFAPTLGGTALNASDYKLLRITGRMPDGLVLQLDSQSCSAQGSGLGC